MSDEFTLIDDPVAAVRARPSIFLGGEPSPERAMSAIVTEAILVTSGPVTALRRDRWWVIYSPLDWFGEYSEKIDELFGRIVPFPEGGRNSSRAEIVLTAFASSVVTASATRVQWIKRDIASVDPTAAWVQQSQPLGRLVAFLWE